MAKSPCMTCGVHDKALGRNKCAECWMRAQPIETQVAAAQVRRSMMPETHALARVPADDWPPERRWCAGCQSFVLLRDCGKRASRCKACASVAAHAARVERVYGITREDVDAGVRSLEAHGAYLAEMPGHPASRDFIPEMLGAQGREMGAEYACLFRAHRLLGEDA